MRGFRLGVRQRGRRGEQRGAAGTARGMGRRTGWTKSAICMHFQNRWTKTGICMSVWQPHYRRERVCNASTCGFAKRFFLYADKRACRRQILSNDFQKVCRKRFWPQPAFAPEPLAPALARSQGRARFISALRQHFAASGQPISPARLTTSAARRTTSPAALPYTARPASLPPRMASAMLNGSFASPTT